jgi:hypothetical protein
MNNLFSIVNLLLTYEGMAAISDFLHTFLLIGSGCINTPHDQSSPSTQTQIPITSPTFSITPTPASISLLNR